MKLEEALRLCSSTQYLARDAWCKKGSILKLVSSAKTIEEINLDLTPESLNADDWETYEIME